jgi:phospholipase C
MLLPSIRSAALLTALATSLGLSACKDDKAAAPKAAAADAADDTTAADAEPADTAAADAAPVDALPTACPVCTSAQYCDEATFACVTRKPETEVAGQRTACAFGPGDLASKTLGAGVPTGKDIPINHFVLVMMENRSFDHYFGAGKDFGLDVDGIAPGQGNPDGKGNTVAPFHTTSACIEDVTHSWTNVHLQLGDGKMDGFVTTNQPDGQRAMGYFDGNDLVFYYDVAKTFGLSDRHFCSALGPTWINRMFFVAGTSFGLTKNQVPPPEVMDQHKGQLILQQLNAKGIDWRIYKTDITEFLLFPDFVSDPKNIDRMLEMEDYYKDAAAGTLPPVSFVQPTFSLGGGERNDEHPPGTPYQGEQFVHSVLTALMDSPNWKDAAYIQTYDEHGGFYDHVVPPEACRPDDYEPQIGGSPGTRFDKLGIRVPMLVASPWSKPGYVSHTVTDNTSILRLLQARFELPAMTHRDANAWPILDFFDFSKQSFATPPKLVAPKPMAAEIKACEEAF